MLSQSLISVNPEALKQNYSWQFQASLQASLQVLPLRDEPGTPDSRLPPRELPVTPASLWAGARRPRESGRRLPATPVTCSGAKSLLLVPKLLPEAPLTETESTVSGAKSILLTENNLVQDENIYEDLETPDIILDLPR